ncbi:MAG: hypothetical protein RL555_792, partial [Bacteroidota bacterium]
MSGLWGLFHSCAGSESDAHPRDSSGEHSIHIWYWMQQSFPLLHEYIR